VGGSLQHACGRINSRPFEIGFVSIRELLISRTALAAGLEAKPWASAQRLMVLRQSQLCECSRSQINSAKLLSLFGKSPTLHVVQAEAPPDVMSE
jgi:hypothetical protein